MMLKDASFLAGAAMLASLAGIAATQSEHKPPASTPASQCSALKGRTLDAAASIVEATLVTGGTLQISDTVTIPGLPAFCRVQGVSRPSEDSDIRFEVWLPQPATWNRRFLSTGEGGFAGQLNYQRNGLDNAMDELLRRGYATASTDTGHLSTEQWWGIGHPEKVTDYLYRAKHVTTVAAKAIIEAYYGAPPSHSYFSSCSNGGRQGLIEAQRYPEDFDGLIIGAPWNFQSHSNAGFVWDAQALAATGAAIPAEKLPAIAAAAVAACDKSDGLADGVIADPSRCAFDPRSLTCAGADGNSCLTPPQVAALQKIYEGPKNPRTGESIFPGFAKGSEAGWTGMVRPQTAASGLLVYFSNIVYQNREWDLQSFNFDSDMAYTDQTVGRFGNATSTDYTAAIRRGVKIIQYHGWNDQTLQPEYSPAYYEQVARANGGVEQTQNFYRLFMVPGMNHCSGGIGASNFGGVGQQIPPVRDAAHDLQTALETWVERGTAPRQLIGTKFTDNQAATRTVEYTRPVCLYPEVPGYKGTGDPKDAASFACVRSTIAP
ncbi:MAG TPA: tannase/feruloyl esterase family alpha/beta hydrolase [Vicinamibacterales bacterium]|nr:tannase/feruloyl esterase family alpha/beta hydrolase [Vicinamibacterales bacterium]